MDIFQEQTGSASARMPPLWNLLAKMMEVAVPAGAIRCAKLQSNRHHQHNNHTFVSPNQQLQCTEEKSIICHGTAHPKLTSPGVYNPCLDHR